MGVHAAICNIGSTVLLSHLLKFTSYDYVLESVEMLLYSERLYFPLGF